MKSESVIKAVLFIVLIMLMTAISGCDPGQLNEVVGALEEISESLEQIAGETDGQGSAAPGTPQGHEAEGVAIGADGAQPGSRPPGDRWFDLNDFIKVVRSARWSIITDLTAIQLTANADRDQI